MTTTENCPHTPPQGIDRDQAREVIIEAQPTQIAFRGRWIHAAYGERWLEDLLDRLAACVGPVEGVFLTPEEAGMALSWWRTHPNAALFPPADDALAARLEAAQ